MAKERTAFRCKGATISSTAVALSAAGWSWTAGDLAKARAAIITARTAGVMVRWDGGAPTASLGHFVPANGTLILEGTTNVNALQLIREASSDSTVSVTLEA